jgi:PAS domain S-box-containing protein
MRDPNRRALTIALTYGAVNAVYIVASDLVLHAYQPSTAIEIAKGLGFVGITATLIYLLTRRYLTQAQAEATRAVDAQQDLRHSRDQLAAAQAVARVGSWDLDLDSGVMRYSDQVYRILGVEPARFEHTLDAFVALVHADDRESLAEAQATALAGNGRTEVEYRIVRPDGSVRYLQVRGTLQSGSDGRPARQFGTVQDVTERKHVELELERRNRQQTAISELGLAALRGSSPKALMDEAMARAARILDVEYTKVLALLPGGEELALVAGIGWRPGLVGTAQVPAGADSQAGFTLLQNSPVVVADLRTESRFSGPALLIDHGVVSGLSTIIMAGGRPWGVLGIHTTRRRTFTPGDVSFVQTLANLIATVVERELAQRAAGERAFLRQMAGEVAGLGGWSYELGGGRVIWSPEVISIHELADDFEPTIEYAVSACVPEHRERIQRRFEACVREGTPYDEEVQIVTAKGRQRWLRVIGRCERDADGRIIRVQGAMQDISDRKGLESMLHQSQRLEAIGQLTGGIAHDFNNLLTVIIGNADLLIDAVGDDQRLHGLAETSRQAARRGADLTQRLLAYARKQPLAPQPTDVADLLAGMDQLLRRSLGERIEIETVRAGGLWRAMVDPAQLESAVLNLCLNARDAMPDGGRLTLETANMHLDDAYAAENLDVTPGHYVMVAVSDSGKGIPPQLAERVFEPFFTTKPAGQGSGLGLSMVYGFVKQSRGHIKLYSEPGEGTTMRLYLPRTREAGAEPPAPPRVDNARGAGELVLVVEDDALVRNFVAQQVQALGYRVVSAADAEQALALLQRHEDVALLFTDVVMPGGMDGRRLAEAARALRPDLPVLYTSGYTENAIVHHGRLDPGVALLNKPYRLAELADKLHRALHAPRA